MRMDKILLSKESLIAYLETGQQIESTDENKKVLWEAINEFFESQNKVLQEAVKRQVSVTLDMKSEKAYVAIGDKNYLKWIVWWEYFTFVQGVNGIWEATDFKQDHDFQDSQ